MVGFNIKLIKTIVVRYFYFYHILEVAFSNMSDFYS